MSAMPRSIVQETVAVSLLLSAAGTMASVCEVEQLRGSTRWSLGQQSGELKLRQSVEVGTLLQTGQASRLRLRCIDGSTLVLADQSRLQIEVFEQSSEQPRLASFLLSSGLLGQRVKPVAQGRWQVRTPGAVTAVRGTEFVVEVNAKRETSVQVNSGEVAIEAAPESGDDGPYTSKSLRAEAARALPAISVIAGAPLLRCTAKGQCGAAPSGAAPVKDWSRRLGSL